MARKSTYSAANCHELVRLMKKGASYQQVAAKLNVTTQTLRNWRDAYPDFKEAYEKGAVLACAWWETELMKGMNDKTKPRHWATSMIYMMKCRFKDFGYNEKTEQTIEITNKHEKMSNKDLDAALKQFHIDLGIEDKGTESESKNQDQEIH